MTDFTRQAGRGGRRIVRAGIHTALGVAALIGVVSGTTQAQCVGDCDGGGTVAINELIRGVNIALASADLSTCPSFDANDSGAVEINELILAVNNALGTCPPSGTATATPTAAETPPTATPTSEETPPTASPTPTATTGTGCSTPTPVSAEGCGNGEIDLVGGETCDDGNTEEGDDCPANCRIATCEPSEATFTVRFDFDTIPADLFIQGGQLFVRYPDGVVSVPGTGSDPPVVESVTSELFSVTPFDRNYGVTVTLTDSTFVGYESGTAATIVFDVCEGAPAPSVCDLTCAWSLPPVDAQFNDVPLDQVPCTIVAP
jgi:cysteine-rich repeat protein